MDKKELSQEEIQQIREKLQRKIIDMIENVYLKNKYKVKPNDVFSKLGLDSSHFILLFIGLENEYNIQFLSITDDFAYLLNYTINELTDFFLESILKK